MGCCDNSSDFNIYDRNGASFSKRVGSNGAFGFWAPADDPKDFSLDRDNKTFVDAVSVPVPLHEFVLNADTLFRPAELTFSYLSQVVDGLSSVQAVFSSNGFYGSTNVPVTVSLERCVDSGVWKTVDRCIVGPNNYYKLNDFFAGFVNDGQSVKFEWRVSFLSSSSGVVQFGDCNVEHSVVIRNSESTL